MKPHHLAVSLAISMIAVVAIPTTGALAAGGTITGHIIDTDSGSNTGATGVKVKACTVNGCYGTAVSDGAGNYVLTGIPQGSWSIVSGPFPEDGDPSCGSGYGRAKVDTAYIPNDGATATAPNMFVTRQKGWISGHVHDTSGNPLAMVSIDANGAEQGGQGFQVTHSRADGFYLLDCLPVFRGYFITSSGPPNSGFSTQSDSQFPVVSGQGTVHDITLVRGDSEIWGHIFCGGSPCSKAVTVLAAKACGTGPNTAPNGCVIASIGTDPTGYYSTKYLTKGSYVVHVFAQPQPFDNAAVFNVVVDDHQKVVQDIHLVPSGFATSGRILGDVRDAAGGGIPNCNVNVFNQLPPNDGTAQGFISGINTDFFGHYDTDWTLTPGAQYRTYLDCPGLPELTTERDIAGNALSIGHGGMANVSWTFGEPARPWTGASDAVGAAAATTDAYFAEGFTGVNGALSFHEYLTVENPNGSDESLHIDFQLGDGTVIARDYNLPAARRITLNVNREVGPFKAVSAHLHANGTFVAERPMYFTYPGGIDGGHDVMGAQTLGSKFYFSEGSTLGIFNEFLTLQNPNPNGVNVNLNYFTDGGPVPTKTLNLAPNSRTTVEVFHGDTSSAVGSCSPSGAQGSCGVGPGIQGVSVQVSVQNPATPILAERPMYFTLGSMTGGHVVVGAQNASTHLDLAEGFVLKDAFNEYLTMFNPGGADANLRISYKLRGGGSKDVTATVPAGHRVTRLVNDDLPSYTENSIHIDSDQPVVVERPMYFNFGGRNGGHDAMAVDSSQLSATSYFAEGSTLGIFDEFLTLENPNPAPVTATINYYTSSGQNPSKTIGLPANSRTTVEVSKGDLNNNGNCNPSVDCGVGRGIEGVSMKVTSSGGNILAERPMYFSF